MRRFARRRWLPPASVALVSLLVSIGLAMTRGMPVPGIHDEFSYLLAGDTFAHGRLTNPPHPLWVHFETIHVLQQPTYASKYPPAQGLMLAAGQIIGHPVFGVWLGTALACAAVTWMLFAWVGPRWALLGGVMTAVHPQVLIWSQTYWGGSVAMAGGALLFGGFRRLLRAPRAGDGLSMALGIALLANSRPYEGAALTALAGAALVTLSLRGAAPGLGELARQASPPMVAVLALTAAAMGFYNFRVTGDPLRLPYQVYLESYAVAPHFLICERAHTAPAYRHAAMRDFQLGYEANLAGLPAPVDPQAPPGYSRQCSFDGFFRAAADKLRRLFVAAFRVFALLLPLLAVPWILRRNRSARLAIVFLSGLVVALLITIFLQPHYAAAGAPLIAVLVLQGLRCLRTWRRDRGWGRALAAAILGLWAVLSVAAFGVAAATPRDAWKAERAALQERLAREGRELVLVRYRPGHDVNREWVYNAADIDASPVVWAREMDAPANRRLLEYFGDRRAWLLDADADPPRLTPYPRPVPDLSRTGTRTGRVVVVESDDSGPG